MSINQRVIAIYFTIIASLISFQYSDASCNIESVKECNKEELRELIIGIIQSKLSILTPNSFTVQEMKTKIGTQVGGMKLVSVTNSNGVTNFVFQGQVRMKADYTDSILIPLSGEGNHTKKMRCFYNINPVNNKGIPIVVMPKNIPNLQKFICIADDKQYFGEAIYANVDVEIKELSINVMSDDIINKKSFLDPELQYKYYFNDHMDSYLSQAVIGKVYGYEQRKGYDTWRTVQISLPDGSRLSLLLDPNYRINYDDNQFLFSATKNYFGGAEAGVSVDYYRGMYVKKGGINQSFEEYLDKYLNASEKINMKKMNNDFLGFETYYIPAEVDSGDLFIIKKGDYYIHIFGFDPESLKGIISIYNN